MAARNVANSLYFSLILKRYTKLYLLVAKLHMIRIHFKLWKPTSRLILRDVRTILNWGYEKHIRKLNINSINHAFIMKFISFQSISTVSWMTNKLLFTMTYKLIWFTNDMMIKIQVNESSIFASITKVNQQGKLCMLKYKNISVSYRQCVMLRFRDSEIRCTEKICK